MGQQEFVTSEGLRRDGRRAKELRRIRCQVGVLGDADGSAMFEMGNTQVLQHTSCLHDPAQPLQGGASAGLSPNPNMLPGIADTACAPPVSVGVSIRIWPSRSGQ
eukprot:GHUV01051645.1.p1 GENE.GHUV01051645.1~~GHUV01051645.1.p1  ORF type:complete len:105 (+),score=9.57 GHUV01051645.1:500-814(+)